LDRFEPGNLYVFSKGGKPPFIPTLKDLLSEAIEPNPAENAQLVERDARVLATEVTPVCDYAQKKMGLSRLSIGFVLPSIHERRVKKSAQFLKRVGPFHLSSRVLTAGAYTLYFNSRYVTSAKPAD